MTLETKRLVLRELIFDDLEALHKVLGDRDIMKYYPEPFDAARVKQWIERNLDRYKTFGFGLWAVCLKKSGELIGDCGLTMQNINGLIRPEIGYHVRADLQRQGYAKEAASAVRDWAFENTTFNAIYSYMPAANIPSGRTAMSYGCRKVDEYFAGDIRTEVYAITRDEWADSKP